MPGLFLYQAQVDAGDRVELVYLSPGAEQVLGWGPADLPIDLERLGSRVHPEDLPAFLPSKAARTRGPIDVEVRMRAHEETPWRWTSVRARAEPAGASTVWSGTVLDVDDRRRLAAALERMQRLEAVGVLAAGVAHNFNNLLAVILPNLEHALEEAPSGLVPPLEDALDASRRARELVHQLTVVGNRDRRQPHGWVDLASLVRNVADLFRSSAGPGLRVDAEIGVDPAPVHGREAQLHQTLMDLALNAQDAVEGQAAPHVVFRLRDAADELRLEIEDNGEGMRSSQIARLGEPFFTTKAPDRGTGLGVATAFRVIRDHGGRMDFASRPGAGTKVSVALPRAPAAPAEPEARDAPPAAARADAPVLVVDDDPLVRRSVARTLRRHRFEVHEAEDGWSALETVRALEVGLMLIDVNMPALSGAEVMSRVAAFRPEVPVVLMSGTLDADVASLGAAALLQKPVRAEALVETVARVLERAGA
jgi:two-component system cell cycle sensor histidine kinase/response regulator CckA